MSVTCFEYARSRNPGGWKTAQFDARLGISASTVAGPTARPSNNAWRRTERFSAANFSLRPLGRRSCRHDTRFTDRQVDKRGK